MSDQVGRTFLERNGSPLALQGTPLPPPQVPSGAFLATARLPCNSVRAFMHLDYQLSPFASF